MITPPSRPGTLPAPGLLPRLLGALLALLPLLVPLLGLPRGAAAATVAATMAAGAADATVVAVTADAAAIAASPNRTRMCAAIGEEQVAELFQRWNRALASGDPGQVSALYSDDALLLPTLSAEPRRGEAAIRDYFVSFLRRAPQGRIDSRTIRLGCDSALDAGTYSFLVRDPDQPAAPAGWVSARYTFVYERRDGEWRIVHHHSSLQPPG